MSQVHTLMKYTMNQVIYEGNLKIDLSPIMENIEKCSDLKTRSKFVRLNEL